MARIAGIDLPKDKRVEIGLTYIFGIGRTSANKILKEAGINPDTRVKDLTEEDVTARACPSAVSAARPTPVPARVRSARSPTRRSKGGI